MHGASEFGNLQLPRVGGGGSEKGIALPKGEACNSSAMHWIGYMHRCWNCARKTPSREIIRKRDFGTMLDVSYGMHVLSFENALERLDPQEQALKQNSAPSF